MGHRWTNTQMRLLRQVYRTASKEKLLRELAPHTWCSIKDTARRAGLKRVGDGITDWLSICASHVYQTSYFRRFNRVMQAAE